MDYIRSTYFTNFDDQHSSKSSFGTASGRASNPAFSLSGFTPAAEAAEATLDLTVYNQGTALVKDFSQFDIDEGHNVISFSDVAASIDLDGWVTLTNNSGTAFPDAKLKLIAGDLQRLPGPGLAARDIFFEAELAADASIEEREFFEYHLYEVPRPVTVRDQETKQIEFVSSSAVPAEKFFVYDGLQCRCSYWYCSFYGSLRTDPSYGIASNPKVMVMLEFDTEEVDADLPRGRVRVYQEDIDGAALLIGEDTIDHTPKGENVRLYVGDAFDIVGERMEDTSI